MDIIKSLEWRYACKKFDKSKVVTNAQLEVIRSAFNLTATSFGLQPVKLLITSNNKILEKLHEHGYYQDQITSCSHLLIICIDTKIDDETIDAKFDLEKEIRGTSEEIVGKFRGQLKSLFKNKTSEDIEKSSIYQAYIILGNLMTVCALQQIDSCPMEGFNAEKFDEVLQLEEKKLKSILLLPIGFRAEDDPARTLKKVRKPMEDIVINLD